MTAIYMHKINKYKHLSSIHAQIKTIWMFLLTLTILTKKQLRAVSLYQNLAVSVSRKGNTVNLTSQKTTQEMNTHTKLQLMRHWNKKQENTCKFFTF